MAKQTDLKIVLIIDEVDKSSNNQLFIHFLAMLRNKYLESDLFKTFHAVVLAGVHDVRTLKLKIRSDEEVTASDDELKDSNLASRSNTNETVRTVVDTVRTNAQGIVRGAKAIDERIVDRQTVAVVIRWDTDSDRASKFFQKRFSTK